MRFALALLLAVPLLAQTPRYQEELTVTEVTIDLNVMDRRGKPVTGLTAADFEVFEDGKPVPITFFREFNAARRTAPATAGAPDAPAAPDEPRKAFVFLDNAEIGQAVRGRMFDSLRESVDAMMSSGVDVAFFLWTDRLLLIEPEDAETAIGILEGWKSNRDLVMRGTAGNRSRTMTLEFDQADLGLSQAVARDKTFNLLAAVDAATRIAAKEPGRRILVLASRGFSIPVPSPFEAALEAEAESLAMNSLQNHPLAPERPEVVPEIMIPTHGEASVGTTVEDGVAAIANRYGIAIYGMFSGGLASGSRPAASEAQPVQREFAIPRAMGQISREVGSMMDIAHRTGGIAIGATSVFKPFLESVEADLNHFYTLAYRSTPELRFRRLEVRPKNKQWTVRHREAAVPDDDPMRR